MNGNDKKPGIGIALVGIGLIVALLAVVALVSSPIMRLLGFRYESLGGFILYFVPGRAGGGRAAQSVV